MLEKLKERISKTSVVRFGDREIITEGLRLSFWADISHRSMTASWPSFIAGAVLVFIVFNAGFAALYWIGDQPISNVARNDYLDYLYFSIETLSTAGYGDMHPQTHYGHFIAAVELFTGIFSMSLMTGLIFSRFSRPSARLLFANHPVICHSGRRADADGSFCQRASQHHRQRDRAAMGPQNTISKEGQPIRRFSELSLVKNEHPALALSWTLYHTLDETSPLHNLDTDGMEAASVALAVVVSGYDVVAAQTIHARKSYDHTDIRFGQRYVDILENLGDGRIRIDYGKFHDTVGE